MSDQPAPAWNPAPSIPLAPPADYPQSIAATPQLPAPTQPAPVAAPVAAPAPAYSPVATAPAPPASDYASAPVPVHVDGPVPADAITQRLLADDSITFEGGAGYDAAAAAALHGDHPVAHSMPGHAVESRSPEPAPEAAVAPAPADASGAWWSPGAALVVAVAAIAWQLVATYAREALPARLASGASIDRFDELVDQLPLAGGTAGQALGFVFVAAAAGLLFAGWKRGVREPLLQGVIAVLTLMALVLPTVL